MSKAILVFIAVLLSAFATNANEVPEGYIEVNDSCVDPTHSHFVEDPLNAVDDYDWLIDELFTPNEIKSTKAVSKSFRPHLKDSLKFFPHPDQLVMSELKVGQAKIISGRITYLSLFPKRYKYKVTRVANDHIKITVKIHFKNATEADINNFAYYFRRAESIWNSSQWARDFKYSFRFKIAESRKDGYFSVNVLDKTRGPYDTNWSRTWRGFTVAHEIGHMMGLSDEYEIISGKAYCLRKSLMCSSWAGTPMKHHYYHILRRLVH